MEHVNAMWVTLVIAVSTLRTLRKIKSTQKYANCIGMRGYKKRVSYKA